MRLIRSDSQHFPDGLTPCLLHVSGFGAWQTKVKGRPKRGDVLHVIWHLPHAPLVQLRTRVVVHALAVPRTLIRKRLHLWCAPATAEDAAAIARVESAHGDAGRHVAEVWVAR